MQQGRLSSSVDASCSNAQREAGFKLSSRRGALLSPSLRHSTLCRAEPEESSSGKGASRPGSVDWDVSWKSFQKQMRSQVDTDPQRKRMPPPRQVRPLPGTPGSRSGPQEQIRRAERLLLDLWTNEDFMKVGGVASLVLFVVFALVIGPPPQDGRCTAFWC